MIKSLIDRLLGKTPKRAKAAASAAAEPPPRFGQRVEYGVDEHRIDRGLIDDNAIDVVERLKRAGYEAYIVGGAVRDLLSGLAPKDFDVATNATPEEVKRLFRRAFIIGRRFRIVHVIYGREVIEVSTFRAYLDNSAADAAVADDERDRAALAGRTHAVDEQGRVLRDNVWGPQHEDAARRDFTVNALYYDPQTEIVVDYHGGLPDLRQRVLRMIGEPAQRYREDPVRLLRAVRFAAKTGFRLDEATRAPLHACAPLLANIPASRLFDETLKLLHTGHALESLKVLRAEGLINGTLPLLDMIAERQAEDGIVGRFLTLALEDTDARVQAGKAVSPSFLFACLLWHEVRSRWNERVEAGEHVIPALLAAADDALLRVGDRLGVQRRIASDLREIWLMQPRFERRQGKAPYALVESGRYRAAYDFLVLRAESGEVDAELPQWWDAFAAADDEQRQALIEAAQRRAPADVAAARKRRRRRKAKRPSDAGDAPHAAADHAAGAPQRADAATSAPQPPAAPAAG
jgi:poly(A) polymerase